MKKLMTLFCLTMALNSFAAETIAKFSFNFPSKSFEGKIANLELKADGSLHKFVYHANKDFSSIEDNSKNKAKHTVIKLNNDVYNELFDKVRILANAELKSVNKGAVCEIAIFGAFENLLVKRDYDFQTKTFFGELEIVQSEVGCYVPTETTPVYQYEKIAAQKLIQSLKILTLL